MLARSILSVLLMPPPIDDHVEDEQDIDVDDDEDEGPLLDENTKGAVTIVKWIHKNGKPPKAIKRYT